MVDEKDAIAIGAIIAMGIGAAYVLKKELMPNDKTKIKTKNEKEDVDIDKNSTESDSVYGITLHGVTWQYLSSLFKGHVPKMDMVYIYPILTAEFKTKWRRGIYNYGASTIPDRLFVVHDSYYLIQGGFPELGNALTRYTNHKIGFEELLREYKKAIRGLIK